ncbi:hypothetical protein D1831_06420 [Lactiplantibacillus garii]|uniref:Uncharacterized protein n=1 Tax=Lactiplantibacillus garii TaxID=2306423 RepID=A0A3R8J8C2_9LACO|nr:hypothetical protein D1831_06420 [Lactiplantibacillus garii]
MFVFIKLAIKLTNQLISVFSLLNHRLARLSRPELSFDVCLSDKFIYISKAEHFVIPFLHKNEAVT